MQFVDSSVTALFPKQRDYIMHELVRLLLYDALVGNNDRHYFNWGIVRKIGNENEIMCSWIFDNEIGNHKVIGPYEKIMGK